MDLNPVSRDWFGLAGFRPGPEEPDANTRLYLLEEVGSTNEFLLGRGLPAVGRLCEWDGWGWRAGTPGTLRPVIEAPVETCVVARRQTKGHGRQGRRWLDCGGLQMSFAMTPGKAALHQGFSVWVGLMVTLVMRECFGLEAQLKWPNDILVRGRKLGGLLLQRSGAGQQSLVVLGLGLNLSTVAGDLPGELQGRATSCFMETGVAPGLGEVVGAVLNRVSGGLGRFSTDGWSADRAALDRVDCLRGREVRLDVAGKVHRGRARGIDESGALLVEDLQGVLSAHHAGEAHVVAEAGLPGEVGG